MGFGHSGAPSASKRIPAPQTRAVRPSEAIPRQSGNVAESVTHAKSRAASRSGRRRSSAAASVQVVRTRYRSCLRRVRGSSAQAASAGRAGPSRIDRGSHSDSSGSARKKGGPGLLQWRRSPHHPHNRQDSLSDRFREVRPRLHHKGKIGGFRLQKGKIGGKIGRGDIGSAFRFSSCGFFATDYESAALTN